jgi:hypothetical protein
VDEPIVADSALKHGLTRDAILHAFRNPIRAYEVDDGFTMLIGTGPSTDLFEVGVVSGSEGPVICSRDASAPTLPRFEGCS